MEIGYLVRSFEQLDSALEWGYDYAEWNPPGIGFEAEDAAETARRLGASRLPVETICGFIGDPEGRGLMVVGPDRDLERLRRYVTGLFDRMQAVGVEVIGYGSGGSRWVPEGFDRGRARGQVREFLELCGEIGAGQGVVTALEPYNRDDANLLNTVPEACELVREIGHPNVRLMADFFHMKLNGESFEELDEAGPFLAHAHIAEPGRGRPQTYPSDHSEYLRALRLAGYDGRVTVTGELPAYESPAETAMALKTAASAPL